jgi:hypothetical protein
VLALIASCVIVFGGAQSDLKQFRDAFALRLGDAPTSKPDPAIQKCMAIITNRIRKETSPSSPPAKLEQVLNFYARGVEAEKTLETDYQSMSGAVSWGQGRVAIGVRMGAVSSLNVFSTVTGKPIALPTTFRVGIGRSPGPNHAVNFSWLLNRDCRPSFLGGGMLMVDSPGIQDVGVRYAYDVWFLEPGHGEYPTATTMSGMWTLGNDGESHLQVDGATLILRSLDSPTAFTTDNVTRLFERVTTYQLGAGNPTLVKIEMKELDLRDLDAWMKRAMGRQTTDLEKQFVAAYGKKPQMLEEYKSTSSGLSKSTIELKFDKTFTFQVTRGAIGFTVDSLSVQ